MNQSDLISVSIARLAPPLSSPSTETLPIGSFLPDLDLTEFLSQLVMQTLATLLHAFEEKHGVKSSLHLNGAAQDIANLAAPSVPKSGANQ